MPLDKPVQPWKAAWGLLLKAGWRFNLEQAMICAQFQYFWYVRGKTKASRRRLYNRYNHSPCVRPAHKGDCWPLTRLQAEVWTRGACLHSQKTKQNGKLYAIQIASSRILTARHAPQAISCNFKNCLRWIASAIWILVHQNEPSGPFEPI